MLNALHCIGHGPTRIVALSGWLGEAADWTVMAEALDPDRYTVLAFDYRGYGRSRDVAGDYGFEEAAQDVLRAVDGLGWTRFSLIGHSMGGVAIQRVLLAAPERVERMLALTAVPACSSRMDAQRLAYFEGAVDDVAQRAAIFNVSTGNRLTAAWCARMAQRSMASATPAASRAYLREWATVDFSEQVQGCTVPVTVVTGEFDPTLTPALMQRTWLAWYPHASARVLANAGHYPMLETPLALAALVHETFGPGEGEEAACTH